MPKQKPTEIQEADLLTVPEAAAFLRLKPSTIRAWILARKLPVIKLSERAVRFRRADLERMVEAALIPAAEAAL